MHTPFNAHPGLRRFHTFYDAAGNQTNDTATGGGARAFDAENRMTTAAALSGGTCVYVYDADGKRVKRNVGLADETWMIYNLDGELAVEYQPNPSQGSPKKEYGYRAGQMLVSADSTDCKWLVMDHLGSTRAVIGKSGSLADTKRRDFKPFGEELAAGANGRTTAMAYEGTATTTGPREKFATYERDEDTGLDFAKDRYYFDLACKFNSLDSFSIILGLQGAIDKEGGKKEFYGYLSQPQHWNGYNYCLNNPLRFNDPTGNYEEIVVKLNLLFSKNSYTAEEKQAVIDSYVQDARNKFGQIGISFQISVSEASPTDNQLSDGQFEGMKKDSLNVFFSKTSVGASSEVTSESVGLVRIQTGTFIPNGTELTHGIIHALGIATGVNGFTGNGYDKDSSIPGRNFVVGLLSGLEKTSAEGANATLHHFLTISLNGTSQLRVGGNVGPVINQKPTKLIEIVRVTCFPKTNPVKMWVQGLLERTDRREEEAPQGGRDHRETARD